MIYTLTQSDIDKKFPFIRVGAKAGDTVDLTPNYIQQYNLNPKAAKKTIKKVAKKK